MVRFLFCCLLCLFPADGLAKIIVHFKPTASVAGPRIVLADIAEISFAGDQTEAIKQLQVGAAPAVGKNKELYTVSVIKGLQHRRELTDVDWQGSTNIIVERRGQRVSRAQIDTILQQYLQENSHKLPQSEIRLTVQQAPEEMLFAEGTLSWKVTPSRPGILGSSNFTIAFSLNGKPAGNCVVRGRLAALAEVVVAATPLHKGDRISSNSVRMERQDIGGLEAPFTAIDQIMDLEVARAIGAGTALDRSLLVLPAVIKGGDLVKISARKGGLMISTSGVAQVAGRLGETIKVKNSSTKKLVFCRVDGPGMVSVEF